MLRCVLCTGQLREWVPLSAPQSSAWPLGHPEALTLPTFTRPPTSAPEVKLGFGSFLGSGRKVEIKVWPGWVQIFLRNSFCVVAGARAGSVTAPAARFLCRPLSTCCSQKAWS